MAGYVESDVPSYGRKLNGDVAATERELHTPAKCWV